MKICCHSNQKKSDEATLGRDIEQQKVDQTRLEADRAAGRMAAESRDAAKMYRDRQAIAGEMKDIEDDQASRPAGRAS